MELHKTNLYTDKMYLLLHKVTKGDYDSYSITSLCKSMEDYFAENKKVAGSIPARAPQNRARNPPLLFFITTNVFYAKLISYNIMRN